MTFYVIVMSFEVLIMTQKKIEIVNITFRVLILTISIYFL